MAKITLFILWISSYYLSNGQISNTLITEKKIKSKPLYFKDSIKIKESATSDYINFYQRYLSGIRGQECPMYPSCSNYSLKIFNETNFAAAFLATTDRLLRCGHDHKNYSLTLRNSGFKFLDFPDYEKPSEDLLYRRNSYYFAYSDTIKSNTSLRFIQNLINNQYFQEALLEIMRIEFKSKSFNLNLFTNKIICLKALEEYEKALFEYETKCPIEYKSNSELVFQIALIQYKLQNFVKAFELNSIAIKTCSNNFCRPKSILLNGLIYANNDDWLNSMKTYKSLSEYESFIQLSNTNFQIAEKASLFRNKKPFIAGIISIIPGLGYVYTGHKQTAITAFLVNGLLAYATYTNFKNENYGMGILTGIFNLSFYIGNINGAKNSAKRFNEAQKKSILNKLEFNTNF